MWTGTKWAGTVVAGASGQWFTFGCPANWYMIPTTVAAVPELVWSVAVQRADANNCTYWITVTNRSSAALSFEGRYAVMSS